MALTAAGQHTLLRQRQLLRHMPARPVPTRVSHQHTMVFLAAAAAAGADKGAAEAAERSATAPKRPFTCVRMRGLPFDVTEEQVSSLLGCDLVDFFCVNRQGRFSGEAFVVLVSEAQVEGALQRDKSSLGKRYVEVYRARRAEYYRAIAAEVNSDTGSYSQEDKPRTDRASSPERSSRASSSRDSSSKATSSRDSSSRASSSAGEQDGVTVLLLRGLPFKAEKEDIVQWFDDVAELDVDDVRIVTGERGRSTGLALVRFAASEDAQQAAAAKHRRNMGRRYIEVYPCSRDEVQHYVKRSY